MTHRHRIVVQCQDERRNKNRAIGDEDLRAKLYDAELERQTGSTPETRRSMIGTGRMVSGKKFRLIIFRRTVVPIIGWRIVSQPTKLMQGDRGRCSALQTISKPRNEAGGNMSDEVWTVGGSAMDAPY